MAVQERNAEMVNLLRPDFIHKQDTVYLAGIVAGSILMLPGLVAFWPMSVALDDDGPSIADFTNAQHSHTNAAGGGQLTTAALSDYAAGTFAPTILFGGNSVGMTYSLQAGRYIRIGNLVYLGIDVRLSAKGSSTGAASIGNLPFAGVAAAGRGWGTVYHTQMATTFVNVGAAVGNGTNALALAGYATAGLSYAALTDAAFGNSTTLQLSIVYEKTP